MNVKYFIIKDKDRIIFQTHDKLHRDNEFVELSKVYKNIQKEDIVLKKEEI
ncbi:MAG: hypothetical protein MJB14_17980 [Spirochaetes bacterium]|nr:hypothetical protein [Spirochaetota bacterium]